MGSLSMVDTPVPQHASVDAHASLSQEQRVALAAQQLAEAQKAFAEKRWREAFASGLDAAKLDPDNRKAIAFATLLMHVMKRYSDANAVLASYLVRHVNDHELLRQFVINSTVYGDFAQLLRITGLLLKSPSLSATSREILLMAAMHAHYRRGEFDRAEALMRAPEIARSRDVFTLRVRIAVERGRADEALALVDQACAANPSDVLPVLEKVRLCIDLARRDEARRSAVLGLFMHYRQFKLRLSHIELLDRPEDFARRRQAVLDYRKDFAGDVPAMIALMEFAVGTGDIALVDELAFVPLIRDSSESAACDLMPVEARLRLGRYVEAESMLGAIPDVRRERFSEMHANRFRMLRLAVRLGANIPESAAAELPRIKEQVANVPVEMAACCARSLVNSGKKEVAVLLVSEAYLAAGCRPADLVTLLDVHLGAGGSVTTPVLLRQVLDVGRPNSVLLRRALALLDTGKYGDSPAIQQLRRDLNTLLSCKPILPEIKPE